MNHITNYYKNKCEILTEQLNSLQNQINKFLKEDDAGDSYPAIAQTYHGNNNIANTPRPVSGDDLMYATSLYNPADGYWNTSEGRAFMSGWSYLARYYNVPSAWGRPGSPPYMASPAAFEAYMRARLPQGVYAPPFRR